MARTTIECDVCGSVQNFEGDDRQLVIEAATKVGWRFLFGNAVESIDLCDRCSHCSGDEAEIRIMEQNIRVKADEDESKRLERGSPATLEIDLPKVVVETPTGSRSLVRVKGISIHKGKVLLTVQK
jgi:hypothetical protein